MDSGAGEREKKECDLAFHLTKIAHHLKRKLVVPVEIQGTFHVACVKAALPERGGELGASSLSSLCLPVGE